jgi:hypothetical protein
MTNTNTSTKRIYVPLLAAQLEHSVLSARKKRHSGRVRFLAIALVIGWFALLAAALWSEMAVVIAVESALSRGAWQHNSAPGRDVRPFRW